MVPAPNLSHSSKRASSQREKARHRKRRSWPSFVLPTIALAVTFSAYFVTVQVRQQSSEYATQQAALATPQNTNARLQSKEINHWIDSHPDTPGARFVHLLRTHLHYALGAEHRRIEDCRHTKGFCFGGTHPTEDLKTTIVPTTSMSVHDVVFLNGDDRIPRLGTDPVCLPLVLAGEAVQGAGVVVEFGPFAGMTTRCMGIGLNLTGRENALFSFDTFENEDNWKAIQSQAPWVKQAPDFDAGKDFVWIWKRVAQSVYPTARPIRGFITKEVANTKVWRDEPIAILSLDSVKDVLHWQDQLAGIKSLKAGSILALQDFLLTDQPTLVYGCLREYLIPVFTCWDFWEPWIFIVKKDMSLQLPCKCMKNLNDDYADQMEEKALQDLDFMGDQAMTEKKNQTMAKLSTVFRTSGSCNNRAIRARARAGRRICGRSIK